MLQEGTVISVNGGMAEVEFVRSAACEKCGACGFGGQKTVRVTAPDTVGAKPGQRVSVNLHAGAVVKASAIAYAFPLCMFLLGLVMGPVLQRVLGGFMREELFTCVTALLFMAAAFAVIRLTDKKRRASGAFSPQIIEILA